MFENHLRELLVDFSEKQISIDEGIQNEEEPPGGDAPGPFAAGGG
jgi:hypothetical protein